MCSVADHFLYQHVNFPTRYREHTKLSMLDLILTSDENDITDIKSMDPIGKNVHVVLMFGHLCDYDTESVTQVRYMYERGDYFSFTSNI